MTKRTKKAPDPHLDHFRERLRRWVEGAHDGNQTSAAKELRVSQPTISAIINGDRGVGLAFLVLAREKMGLPLDELLNLPPLRRLGAVVPATEVSIGVGFDDRIREAVRRELASRQRTPAKRRAK